MTRSSSPRPSSDGAKAGSAPVLDVFALRKNVVDEYKRFATSFTTIHAQDIREQVAAMNALANSQMEELSKFIDQVPGDRPITFARYTGQEDTDQRRRVADDPPDILLTNFMMLELLMTRQEELDRRVIGNCAGLRFLVLDELHTYRGRQGADVALLVRRVRERLQPEKLLCIGTSATMASEGSLDDKSRVVAGVASKLFGVPIADSNIISETLERVTDSSATADSVRPDLRPTGRCMRGVAELRSSPALWRTARRHLVRTVGNRTLLDSSLDVLAHARRSLHNVQCHSGFMEAFAGNVRRAGPYGSAFFRCARHGLTPGGAACAEHAKSSTGPAGGTVS